MTLLIEQAIAIFSENGIQFTRMDEGCLQASFEAKHASYEVFVEAYEDLNIVGIYIYPPTKISDKSLSRIMEYITRINYGLRLGHFELDLDDGVLRFAHATGIEGSHITAPMLLNVLYFGLSALDDYYPGLMQIIFSGLSPKRACEETKQRDRGAVADRLETGGSNRPMDRLRH